jgi:hydroxymethylpyrimidine pyrophosphatase-like HAD family hydrolase
MPRTQPTDRLLIALDIDGTLLERGGRVPPGTVEALDLVRAAGHTVTLATGRSLVGLMPVATRLGLTDGLAVCSNGAITVHLDSAAPSGYVVCDARSFDPGLVITRTLQLAPDAEIGVEEVGWGWRVNQKFEGELLNGEQKIVPVAGLAAGPAVRIAIQVPEARPLLGALRATGATVTPAGVDWLDVTAPHTGKDVALERIRVRLGVPRERTVAVGDGSNDLGMVAWAGRGVAMGHGPSAVQEVADEVTGTIGEGGAVLVLRSVLPVGGAGLEALSALAAQLVTAVRTTHGPAVLRVWHDQRPGVVRCDVWTCSEGAWVLHGPILSGGGATMRAIEAAAREAGLRYPRGDVGRRRARWRSVRDVDGRVGFELPLAHA